MTGEEGGMQTPLGTKSVEITELGEDWVQSQHGILIAMDRTNSSLVVHNFDGAADEFGESIQDFGLPFVGRLLIEAMPIVGGSCLEKVISQRCQPDPTMNDSSLIQSRNSQRQDFSLGRFEADLMKPGIGDGIEALAKDEFRGVSGEGLDEDSFRSGKQIP